eukprot:g16468.t1
MEDEAWVADYFSVVGARNDGDLELLDPEGHSPEMLKCVWEDAITDIAVVRTGKGELCPEGYELIDRTPMDHDADLNHGSMSSWGFRRAVHLAVRRQHVSKRDDYIAEIQVVFASEDKKLPDGQGWELVEKSASGKRANLNKGGDDALLAVRRAVRDLVDCPAAVCSVCVLLRNKELPPPGYRVIQKDLNRGKSGDVVQLGYQVGGALSTVRLPFRPTILDRYPEQDSKLFPFPGDQLPMFVYPKGMLLERRSGRDTPKSSFFSFVFTNVHGCRTFTACLTFYEPILPSTARRLTKKLFTCRRPESLDPNGVGPEQATQGRMRIGLPGSNSFGGGLSTLSQSGQPRSRSGTGSWSGGDRAASAAATAGWPRGFARGGGGGGVGVSGCRTPPMAATSTSWTKLSAATLAAQRFGSCATHQDGISPSAGSQQPSAAEVFSGTCDSSVAAASALADDAPVSRSPEAPGGEKEEKEEKEMYSPLTLRSAYQGADGGGSEGVRVGGPPVAERRWQDGEVPFRENGEGDEDRKGVGLVVAAEGTNRRGLHKVVTGTKETRTREATPRGGAAAEAFGGGVQPAPAAAQARLDVAVEPGPGVSPASRRPDSSSNSNNNHNTPAGSADELSDEEYNAVCRREDRPCIFAPKTICVISRFPIYGVLRRFLRHLYAISLSRSGVPLERYISMFVSCIPMPPPGGCPFHVYLERLENQDPLRSRLKPLSLQMPPAAWLPLMDIDFAAPFRCLSVQSVLTVFALMLQEAKILFLSSRAELLTQVMEALRSLLFPMEWQSVYVPQLPYALAGYLECPGGFMIGMRLTKAELERGTGGTATVVRDLGLEGVANAVNLDAGEVLLYSGHLMDSVKPRAGDNQQFQTASHSADDARGLRSPSGLSSAAAASSRRHSWPRQPSTRRRRQCPPPAVLLRQALDGTGSCLRRAGRRSNSVDRGVTAEGSSGSISPLPHHTNGGGPRAMSGRSNSSFIAKDEETATPWLPVLLHDGLAARLERELFGQAAGVRVGVEEELDQYESAFEFAPAPDRTDTFLPHFSSERIQMVDARGDRLGTAGKQPPKRHHGDSAASTSNPTAESVDTTSVVRDCFLCCMSELLGGICGSLRQSESKRSRHSLRTKPLDELFNMRGFLDGMDRGSRPFLQRLASTQMFWVMVQQWLGRSAHSDDSRLLFFEECAVAVKNRRVGAVVPWRDRGTLGDDGLGGLDRGEGSGGWSHNGFIPLVDEVRLKRPDLYGLNSYNLYGSARLEESRSTPLATPLAGRSRQRAPWELDPNTARGAEVAAVPRQQGVDKGTDEGDDDAAENQEKIDDDGGGGGGGSGDAGEGFCPVCTGPPIIIPGPTAEGIAGDGKEPLFRYDDGWPTPLDRGLLHTPPEALPPVVLELQRHASVHSSQDQRHQKAAASGSASASVEDESKSAADMSMSVSASSSQGRTVTTTAPAMLGTSSSGRSSTRGQNRSGGCAGQPSHAPQGSDLPVSPGYEGSSRFGRPHGRGRMVYADSTVYDGEFRQGQRHGEGCMTGAGCQYTGQWKMGKKEGAGTMKYPDGARYEGSWENDQRHGHGTYHYASGAVYDGLWENGKMHGNGSYTGASGSRYEGMYRCGVRRGHATMTYSGGQTYVGEWEHGVRSGFGKYTLPNGTVYEGHFKRDRKHGTGTLRRLGEDEVTSQLWENGKLVGAPLRTVTVVTLHVFLACTAATVMVPNMMVSDITVMAEPGDGYCDEENNTQGCNYDGGDCCECTCDPANFEDDRACRGGNWKDFACIDPTAACVDDDSVTIDMINICDASSIARGRDDDDSSPCVVFACLDPDAPCVDDDDIVVDMLEDCRWLPAVGDGNCDMDMNIPECNYDGGDCCECTCQPLIEPNDEDDRDPRVLGCFDFACLDPEAACFDDDSITIDKLEECENVLYIGDGKCNPGNNIELCAYDGGDCCSCTCIYGIDGPYSDYACGGDDHYGFDCQDPDAPCFGEEKTLDLDDDHVEYYYSTTKDDGTSTGDDATTTEDDDTTTSTDDDTEDDSSSSGDDDTTTATDDDTEDDSSSSGDDDTTTATDDDTEDDDTSSGDDDITTGTDDDTTAIDTSTGDDFSGGDDGTAGTTTDDDAIATDDDEFEQEEPFPTVDGAVEVATKTEVRVAATAYDERPGRSSNMAGCGDEGGDGCAPSNSRDGVVSNVESRWSCATTLVGGGGPCQIEYTFAEPQDIVDIQVAFWKGDERTRTLDVYLDGELAATHESYSGSTFNSLATAGNEVTTVMLESVGLLSGEWISLLEVLIFVTPEEVPLPIVDGAVEVATKTDVGVTATAYDERPGRSSNMVGCGDEGGDGCAPSNSRDGIVSEVESRWSCATKLVGGGGPCQIEFMFAEPQDIVDIQVAFWKGDERDRTLEVQLDGELAVTHESYPGSTFDTLGVAGDDVTTVMLESVGLTPDEWISIIEVLIFVKA